MKRGIWIVQVNFVWGVPLTRIALHELE